jgi:predicted dehydrogenase
MESAGRGCLSLRVHLPSECSPSISQCSPQLRPRDDRLWRRKKRRVIAGQYELGRTYSYDEYDRLLTSGTIDAVYVTLPNHMHRLYVERALRVGIHVLCEKPLGLTAMDCRAMVRVASRGQAQLMVAYRLHFDEANLRMLELANSGRLGHIRIFHSLFTQQVKAGDTRLIADVGGGPLLDIGVYCINAARYLFQAEPTEVFAAASRTGESRFREVPEMHAVIMRFPEDRLATFVSSFGAADRAEYDLVGTKGTARLESAYEYAQGMRALITVGDRTTTKQYPKRDQFGPQLLYFSDCILHKRSPEPSGLEGTLDVAVIEALQKSAARGRSVKVAIEKLRHDARVSRNWLDVRRFPLLSSFVPRHQRNDHTS